LHFGGAAHPYDWKASGEGPHDSIYMSDTNPKSAASLPGVRLQVPIHFVKSSHFRVVYASGVWYGGDSQQNLHLTFFNERPPIPKKLVFNLSEQGMIVSEDAAQRESKEGIVREIEIDVVLSVQAAVEFHKTLGENLKAIQSIHKNETTASK
jgi:hypothetical protein